MIKRLAVPNTQNAGGNLLLTRPRDHHPVAVCALPRRAAHQPLGGNAARSEGLSIPTQGNARRSGPSSIAQEVQAVVGPAASTASLSCPIAGNGEAALQDAPRCSARATDRRGAALYVTSTQKTLPKAFQQGQSEARKSWRRLPVRPAWPNTGARLTRAAVGARLCTSDPPEPLL